MLHISRVAWARWETYMPLQPTTPTETEHRKPGTQLHKTLVWGVLFLNLSAGKQGNCTSPDTAFNTVYCFFSQHCADQHLFIVLLVSRCSSIAYISCFSANIFNLELSEHTISWRSVLTVFYTCMNSAQHMQTTPVTEKAKKHGLFRAWWNPSENHQSSGFSWSLYLRLQNIHRECGKSS